MEKANKALDEQELQSKRYLEMSKRYIKDEGLVKKNQLVLEEYYNALLAGNGFKVTSNTTIKDIIYTVMRHGRWLKKPFDEATEKDIEGFFAYLKEDNKQKSTRNNYVIRVRQFYKWLYKTEDYPDLVKQLKMSKITARLDQNRILSPNEIRKLISVNTWSKNRAIISGLYESGCRISEFLGLRIKDVSFDDYGIRIFVKGKTGERNIRLIDSEPYFREWINEHPFGEDRNYYLFINFATNFYGRQLQPGTINSLLRTSANKAGIEKYITCHLLRHSRLTFLAKNQFNERDLRIFAGWSGTSDMPNVYLHYGEEEVERKLLESRGLLDKEKQEELEKEKVVMEPINCPRCKQQNPATAKYCNCGLILDDKEAFRIDGLKKDANEFTNKLMNQPINNVDTSKGMMEALFQTMINNPLLVEEFKKICYEQ